MLSVYFYQKKFGPVIDGVQIFRSFTRIIIKHLLQHAHKHIHSLARKPSKNRNNFRNCVVREDYVSICSQNMLNIIEFIFHERL